MPSEASNKFRASAEPFQSLYTTKLDKVISNSKAKQKGFEFELECNLFSIYNWIHPKKSQYDWHLIRV